MHFQIHALPPEPFASLLALPDDALHARGIRRVIADGRPAYPCRVSLQDAVAGEHLLLLPYAHQNADTPYRASGPIYVREAAAQAHPAPGEIPELLRSRLLSLRAYDAQGMMRAAEVVPGTALEAGIAALLADAGVDTIHLHFARPGCYACRVERVSEPERRRASARGTRRRR